MQCVNKKEAIASCLFMQCAFSVFAYSCLLHTRVASQLQQQPTSPINSVPSISSILPLLPLSLTVDSPLAEDGIPLPPPSPPLPPFRRGGFLTVEPPVDSVPSSDGCFQHIETKAYHLQMSWCHLMIQLHCLLLF